MPGFPRVLISMAEAYRERPEDIKQTADSVLGELKRSTATSESGEVLSTELLDVCLSRNDQKLRFNEWRLRRRA